MAPFSRFVLSGGILGESKGTLLFARYMGLCVCVLFLFLFFFFLCLLYLFVLFCVLFVSLFCFVLFVWLVGWLVWFVCMC